MQVVEGRADTAEWLFWESILLAPFTSSSYSIFAHRSQNILSSINSWAKLKCLCPSNFDFIFTPDPGKILIIGGSIANFTNVAATFKVTRCEQW